MEVVFDFICSQIVVDLMLLRNLDRRVEYMFGSLLEHQRHFGLQQDAYGASDAQPGMSSVPSLASRLPQHRQMTSY